MKSFKFKKKTEKTQKPVVKIIADFDKPEIPLRLITKVHKPEVFVEFIYKN